MAALGFTDIHTHILPGVDDGAADLAAALAMLRGAYADGIRAVILTPHYRGQYRARPENGLLEAFAALRAAAARELPDMELYLGREVRYQSGVMEQVAEKSPMALADSDYILLEFSPTDPFLQLRTGVEEVAGGGYVPVLAHAERYACLRQDPELVRTLCQEGALIQLNAGSVTGEAGFFIRRFCGRLLKAGLVHFIASDAHDEKERPPRLRRCYEKVSRRYGEALARRLFMENPQILLKNDMI